MTELVLNSIAAYGVLVGYADVSVLFFSFLNLFRKTSPQKGQQSLGNRMPEALTMKTEVLLKWMLKSHRLEGCQDATREVFSCFFFFFLALGYSYEFSADSS